jgi:hypothetical protein
MENLNILVENTHVKKAFDMLLDNYKDQFAIFLNNVLKNEVGASDVLIEKGEDGVFKVWQSAPDKGYVLAQVDGKVQLHEYKTLSTDTKYVVFDGQKLALFLKEEDGTPDSKVGLFLNLNEVVNQIDSPSVQEAIQTVKSNKINDEVIAKQVEKRIRKATKGLKKA